MNEKFFPRVSRRTRCGVLLLSFASISLTSQPSRAQTSASHAVSNTQDAIPQAAIPAILKAFETFEVVGIPAGHGQKDIDDFILSLIREAFAVKPSKTVADQIDAFLYLGPQKLLIAEPVPEDIALDRTYRSEWLRRMKLVGMPGPSTLEELDAQIVASAGDPMLTPPPRQSVSQEMKVRIRQGCLSEKHPAASQAK
jgi:hypothetical protein